MSVSLADLTPEQIAALPESVVASMLAAAPAVDEVTAKVLADAPSPERNRATTAKAAASAKPANLTPMIVANGKAPKDHAAGLAMPDEGVAFLVVGTWGKDHNVRSNGAAIQPYVNGKVQRSLTRDVVAALADDDLRESLENALETVDKRARIGSHRVVAEVAS